MSHVGQVALRFFDHVADLSARDFIILVDRGNIVQGVRWLQTKKAIQTMLPYLCGEDGLSFYLFSQKVERVGSVKAFADLEKLFSAFQPGGDTYLAKPLDAAIKEHMASPKKPTSILVMTGCVFKDDDEVKKLLVAAADRISNEHELTISFIQVRPPSRLDCLGGGLVVAFSGLYWMWCHAGPHAPARQMVVCRAVLEELDFFFC